MSDIKNKKTWDCKLCKAEEITEGKTPEGWRVEYSTRDYEHSIPVMMCFKCFKKVHKKVIDNDKQTNKKNIS